MNASEPTIIITGTTRNTTIISASTLTGSDRTTLAGNMKDGTFGPRWY